MIFAIHFICCENVFQMWRSPVLYGRARYRLQILLSYRSFAITVSQLKTCDFARETSKGFEVLQFSTSATTTQLLSSGEFCKLRYDTIPVKSASANVSFYINNSKNFELSQYSSRDAIYLSAVSKCEKHLQICRSSAAGVRNSSSNWSLA